MQHTGLKTANGWVDGFTLAIGAVRIGGRFCAAQAASFLAALLAGCAVDAGMLFACGGGVRDVDLAFQCG